ncbi:hypothetical protein ONQ97_26835, partial [Salmonella enterica subsp. enterica serovar Virginia]|nr:hypothetical protein [Salmonella enterica subsp. enterica serovar Virginia]
NKEDEKIRFRDIQAQPRKIISSPTWSGLESEHVSYNAGYTNVITLSKKQDVNRSSYTSRQTQQGQQHINHFDTNKRHHQTTQTI